MTTSHKVTVSLAVILCVVASIFGYSWLKAHDANILLSAQKAANADALATIKTSEETRVATLENALDKLTQLQQRTKTPAQVAAALPTVIQLPAPVQQVTQAQAAASPALHEGDLIIPAIDAKPWFDAQIECKKCGASLASTQQQVVNLTAVIAVKDKEIAQRDQALKGGTKVQRAKTAGKWASIGAVVGGTVVAVLIARHH